METKKTRASKIMDRKRSGVAEISPFNFLYSDL